jgi:hypothetical protein
MVATKVSALCISACSRYTLHWRVEGQEGRNSKQAPGCKWKGASCGSRTGDLQVRDRVCHLQTILLWLHRCPKSKGFWEDLG